MSRGHEIIGGKSNEPKKNDEPICLQNHSQHNPSYNNQEKAHTERNSSLYNHHKANKNGR